MRNRTSGSAQPTSKPFLRSLYCLCRFVLRFSTRCISLRAPTPKDRTRWVNVLRSRLHAMKRRQQLVHSIGTSGSAASSRRGSWLALPSLASVSDLSTCALTATLLTASARTASSFYSAASALSVRDIQRAGLPTATSTATTTTTALGWGAATAAATVTVLNGDDDGSGSFSLDVPTAATQSATRTLSDGTLVSRPRASLASELQPQAMRHDAVDVVTPSAAGCVGTAAAAMSDAVRRTCSGRLLSARSFVFALGSSKVAPAGSAATALPLMAPRLQSIDQLASTSQLGAAGAHSSPPVALPVAGTVASRPPLTAVPLGVALPPAPATSSAWPPSPMSATGAPGLWAPASAAAPAAPSVKRTHTPPPCGPQSSLRTPARKSQSWSSQSHVNARPPAFMERSASTRRALAESSCSAFHAPTTGRTGRCTTEPLCPPADATVPCPLMPGQVDDSATWAPASAGSATMAQPLQRATTTRTQTAVRSAAHPLSSVSTWYPITPLTTARHHLLVSPLGTPVATAADLSTVDHLLASDI